MAGSLGFRAEPVFRAWARCVLAHPWLVGLPAFAAALVATAGVSRLTLDVAFESFLQDDDPALLAYQQFTDTFGRDDRILISAEPGLAARPHGVFERDFLERLRALHQALEEGVPHLEEITSLVNARDTRAEGDTLLVEEFLDPWPEDDAAIAVARARAADNPLFEGTLLAGDAKATALVLELQFDSAPESGTDDLLAGFGDDGPMSPGQTSPEQARPSGLGTQESVEAVRRIVAEHASPDFVLHSAGTPLVLQDLTDAMGHDMPRFLGLTLVSIAALLYLLFRRRVAVLAPLLVVALTVGATFGLMGWSGIPMGVPTQILPTLLLAACIGNAIHVLAIFYQRRHAGDEEPDALVHALGHSGLPIALTSVTTAVGLASFATSDIAPIGAIGIFAPLGVLIALALSLTLLPALMVLLPMGAARAQDAAGQTTRSDRALASVGLFALRNPVPIAAIALLLGALALSSALRLRLSHDPMTWFPDGTPIKESTYHVDALLGGSVSFEVLLEREQEGQAKDPATLKGLAAFGRDLETTPRGGYLAGRSTSLADLVKEIHRALNEDRPEAYVVPDDPDAVAQEILLFESEGGDDLADFMDGDAKTLRMSIRMPWQDSVYYRSFFEQAERDAKDRLDEFGETTVTGMFAVSVQTIAAVVSSMANSYIYSFVGIALMMMLLLGSVRWGLLAMVPNVFPILLTLGYMSWAGLPLDSFTLMIGAIALGVCDDDTIHSWHHIRTLHRQGVPLESAVMETLATTGRAALFASIVLSAGFIGFTLSSMWNLQNFGKLVTLTIALALASEFLLGPALLALADRMGLLGGKRRVS